MEVGGGGGRRVWIGRSKKHSWKGKISRISRLEKISSIDLQVFTNRPNFRMGCKTCKVNKISSFLASSVQGGFSSKQHFKTDNFWKTLYCEAVRSPVLSLPTGPQYCSLFSYFCDFIKKDRTTTICLTFSNPFSIKNAIFQRKTLFAICTSPIIQLVCPKNIPEHCLQFLPKSIKKKLCKILWDKQGL